MDTLYCKVGRRYKPVPNWDPNVFPPVEGLWLVMGGGRTCIVRIADLPKFDPQLRAKMEMRRTEACKALAECLGKTISPYDVVTAIFDAVTERKAATR